MRFKNHSGSPICVPLMRWARIGIDFASTPDATVITQVPSSEEGAVLVSTVTVSMSIDADVGANMMRAAPVADPVVGNADGEIALSISFDANEISTEFDPEDPILKRLLGAHPELRPYVCPTLWDHLLDPEF